MSENSHTPHVHRDDFGAKMGMWLFLFTELILFGGLFITYMYYRAQYNAQFVVAASELNVGLGAFNTMLLLTSSLTAVLSVAAMKKGNVKLSKLYILATVLMAIGFLVVKFFEWSAKISHGIYPGSPELLNKASGEIIFFGLYYVMTGLHGFHIIVGITIYAFNYAFIKRNIIRPDSYIKLESAGLYWHLVDLIWIFLFPLFYLLH